MGALLAGAACGLFPLVFGLIRGQTPLAVGGLLACLVGDFVLGLLLAVPLAILFMVLIHLQSRQRQGSGRPAASA